MFASKDLFFSKPSGYQISRSVRLRSSASAYLNRTFTTPTNNKIWTWSGWVKRGSLGATSYRLMSSNINGDDAIRFDAATPDTFRCYFNGATSGDLKTTQVFRDPSAWYHIVVAVDTTQATASNRVKIYVNGVQVTAFGTATYPTQNYNTSINASGANFLGSSHVPSEYFDGYLTEVNFIDGQALTPSSFGQTNTVTGVWQPIKYTGTYGTNGFYLNFSDNSNNTATTIGKDYSGNGNNWTPNNISVTAGVTYDSMLDVPTLFADGGNGRGNYCTLNPANNTYSTGSGPKFFTLTNGNLTGTTSAGGGASRVMGTVGVSSGKWYAEATIGAASINASADQGLICVPVLYQASAVGGGSGGVVYIAGTGQKRTDAGSYAAYGSTYTTGDVIGVALDMDSGTVTFYKNNVSQGVALSGLTGSYTIGAQANDVTSNANYATYGFNFGQRPFTYTPPTGFVALNTQNLPTPTISNGANYMAASLYTGNNTGQAITNTVNGVSLQPDLLWIKVRSNTYGNSLADSVRGVSASLESNSTAAEVTNSELTSFNSNGFTLGATGSLARNVSGQTYVAWQWKAGGTSSSNTSGSITSTVSAGATQGFSVVTYAGNSTTGATVGHGLGVAPKMVIIKNRSAATVGAQAQNWIVYNSNVSGSLTASSTTFTLPATANVLCLNLTTASGLYGMDAQVNGTGYNYVAYCFSEVAGYSKFGSYTGNGSADGPFVYCGFRPRWIMIKQSNAVRGWNIEDTSRSTYNSMILNLDPGSSAAENSNAAWSVDAVSNGFKIRTTDTSFNASSGTYIFAAFAENPFKNSLAR
jgi:hypothetical protein